MSAANIRAKRKAQIVDELRQDHSLKGLLNAAKLARSTFYYHAGNEQCDPCQPERKQVHDIYHKHKGCYGYRRITATLRQSGMTINHKKVQRLMGELSLCARIRQKKYQSYKGAYGKVAPNLLHRRFTAAQPNEKWVTDVTEFRVLDKKLYLSPVMDLYNGEIIAYQMDNRPSYQMVDLMLTKATRRLGMDENPVLHSDQGWQYQSGHYQRKLEQYGITQSMSRKGNCYDNAVIESFFGTLKTECCSGKSYTDIDNLMTDIDDYIHYYNHERIKLKLNGLSPVQYRTQAI